MMRRRRPLFRTVMMGDTGHTVGKTVAMGPVQLLVIGLPDAGPNTGIKDELEWLRENDIIRLIDLLLVRKDKGGNISTLETGDPTEDDAADVGAVVGALIGYGAAGEEGAGVAAPAAAEAATGGSLLRDDDMWFADDLIPNGSAVAVALIEHQWAVPLQEAIAKAGGVALADAWVHPADLTAVGILSAGDAPKRTA